MGEEVQIGHRTISTKTWLVIALIVVVGVFAFFIGKEGGKPEVIYLDQPNAYVDSVLVASEHKFDSVVAYSNRGFELRDSTIRELKRSHRLNMKLQKVRNERYNKMVSDSIVKLWVTRFDSARFARARRTD